MKSLVKKLLVVGMLLATVSSQVVFGASESKESMPDGPPVVAVMGSATAAADVRIVSEENATDNERNFLKAVRDNDLDTVQLLCAEDLGLITRRYQSAMYEITYTNPSHFTTPFHIATLHGNTAMVLEFCKRLDLNTENPEAREKFASLKDADGYTPLPPYLSAI